MGRPRVEHPDYYTAHWRIRKDRGKARLQRCVDCGALADDWSYDGLDDGELTQVIRGKAATYSVDPSHYHPRCRSCHARFDASPSAHIGIEATSEKCGTYAGWNEHVHAKTPICFPCGTARNEYMRNYRARKRQAS